MKKLVLALLAVAALATGTAASASACNGKQHSGSADRFRTVSFSRQHGWTGRGTFEKLNGTGSSFAADSSTASGSIVFGRPLDSGTFDAALSTDWSQAKSNRHGGSCAPGTGTLSLGDASGDTLATSLDGVTCTVGSNPWNVAAVYFGKAEVTSSTGTLANVTGRGRVLLVEKTDGTVKGFAFAGFKGWHERWLAGYAKDDAHNCGWH